jgi:hypothetical protein
VRKRDPNAVIDQFAHEVNASLADWRATRQAVGDGGPLAQRASMDAFTRLAVAYERFRSEWHVAAITRDATEFKASQRRRVEAALKETRRDGLVAYLPVALALPLHPTLDEVAKLLDPSGGNVSITGVSAWQDLAKKHLRDPWRGRIDSLTWADGRVTESVIALRNAAAHQSTQTHERLTAALDGLTHASHRGLKRPDRGVSPAGIPAYLNGVARDAKRRVELYHELVRDLAERLRVT